MRLRWVPLIGLVAGGLGFAGWHYAKGDLPFVAPAPADVDTPSGHVVTADQLSSTRKSVEARMREAPEYANFFDRLRNSFPADYGQVVDGFARRLATSGTLESADVYLSDAFRALRQTRGIVAAAAGPAALGRVFDTEATVLKALGEADPHLCVDFLYGGATQAYFAFSAAHRVIVADMALAGLDAVIDGHEKNVERGKPTDADFQMLEQALTAKGLSRIEIGALIDGKIPDPPMDDARMCAADQIEFQVLKSLPEDQRLKIYGLEVELMARS